METIDFGKDAASPSGAPQFGGATSRGSRFGGDSVAAMIWRAIARVARDIEAQAYRRLRDLDQRAAAADPDVPRPGAPNRVRHAYEAHDSRIH